MAHTKHNQPNRPESTFWENMDRSGDCWLWLGKPEGSNGYGRTSFHGRRYQAHRLAYELSYGPIPDGMIVCHECDTPLCCRPDHLFLGTHIVNMDDMVTKGRAASGNRNGARAHPERLARGERNGMNTHPERRPHGDSHWKRLHPEKNPRGAAHGRARLAESDVREIIAQHEAGASIASLSARFRVGRTTIVHIVRRETWQHLTASATRS